MNEMNLKIECLTDSYCDATLGNRHPRKVKTRQLAVFLMISQNNNAAIQLIALINGGN